MEVRCLKDHVVEIDPDGTGGIVVRWSLLNSKNLVIEPPRHNVYGDGFMHPNKCGAAIPLERLPVDMVTRAVHEFLYVPFRISITDDAGAVTVGDKKGSK